MRIKKSLLGLILLLAVTLIISGCMATSIKDVKSPDYVGKTVRVSGTVENTIKIGELSGYTLKDKTDTIGVSSETLPVEGSKITVTGMLIKDTLLGYYIKAS
ncbi:hypothetical protein COV13_00815 [Candidatus Woesearchaeota archaeon CG10_big_fil_rev_8_21_14_0_10_32_9]|nr:MAG: hypothetical protein COV13_00815 [Candidatus Woesearchaeota archaeon CG10_big_fil_rev_8_21_14_0_10_32_9]